MKPIIDKILAFTISKKLSVFIIATFLIFAQKLDAEQWVNISIMYIGTQGALDIISEMIKLRK